MHSFTRTVTRNVAAKSSPACFRPITTRATALSTKKHHPTKQHLPRPDQPHSTQTQPDLQQPSSHRPNTRSFHTPSAILTIFPRSLFYTPHGVVIGAAFTHRPPKPHSIDHSTALELAMEEELELRKVDKVKFSQLLELEDLAVFGFPSPDKKASKAPLASDRDPTADDIDPDAPNLTKFQQIYWQWEQRQQAKRDKIMADANAPIGFTEDDPRFDELYEAQRLLRLQYNEPELRLDRLLGSDAYSDDIFGENSESDQLSNAIAEVERQMQSSPGESLKNILGSGRDGDDEGDDDDDDYYYDEDDEDEYERDKQDVLDRLHLVKLFKLDGREGNSMLIDRAKPGSVQKNRNWLEYAFRGETTETHNDKDSFDIARTGPDDFLDSDDDYTNPEDDFKITEYDWEVIKRVRAQQIEAGRLDIVDGFLGLPPEFLDQIELHFDSIAEFKAREMTPGYSRGVESAKLMTDDQFDKWLFDGGERNVLSPEMQEKERVQQEREAEQRVKYWEDVKAQLFAHLEAKIGKLGPMPNSTKDPEAYGRWVKRESSMSEAVQKKLEQLQYDSPEARRERLAQKRKILDWEYEAQAARIEEQSLIDAYNMSLKYSPEQLEALNRQLEHENALDDAEDEYYEEHQRQVKLDPVWRQERLRKQQMRARAQRQSQQQRTRDRQRDRAAQQVRDAKELDQSGGDDNIVPTEQLNEPPISSDPPQRRTTTVDGPLKVPAAKLERLEKERLARLSAFAEEMADDIQVGEKESNTADHSGPQPSSGGWFSWLGGK